LDSDLVDSSLATTATELNGNPDKKNSLKGRENDFSRGTRKWQTYASAAAGDHGKGEMYALHAGYGYFLRDYLSFNINVLGAYIRSGIDDNGVAAGLDIIFRRHFSWINDDPWSVYLDLGGGGTLRVSDHVRMMGGIRYLHISDAGIDGGGGVFDGFMFYGGAMFPF
jgi:hypothetical protein